MDRRHLFLSTALLGGLWIWHAADGHLAEQVGAGSAPAPQSPPVSSPAPSPAVTPVTPPDPPKEPPRHRHVAARTTSPPVRLEPLEIDLELDPPDKVVEAIESRPGELAAARTRGDELLFMYGYALKGAGRYADALAPLLAYHDAKGALSTYAALLLGESCLELKLPDDAAKWFSEAQAGFPPGERQVQARFGLARGLLLKGEAAQAAADLEKLLNDAPKSRWRYEIRLKLAQAYERNGQLEDAISTLEWLWAWVPAHPEAETAGREIARLQEAHIAGYTGPNVAVRYRRALRLLQSGQVEPGLSLMLALAQDPAVTASLPRSFTFELAKAYFQAKQYTEAAEQLDQWYSRCQGNERAEALYWRALTQGRLARFDDSVALYRQLARMYPKSGYSEIGMFKIGLLRLDQGDYGRAEEAFAAFREKYPRSKDADNAQWYVAWSQLRQGRFDAAQASYDELARRYPRSALMPGVRYWQGRMAQERGDTTQAAASYQQVLGSSIASHYQALAEMRLKSMGQSLEPEPVAAAAAASAILELPHPELLERTKALMAKGLRTWAQEELATYESSLKSRDELLALADWYRRTGDFGNARLLVSNLGLGEGVPRLQDPDLPWRLSYPLAYQDQLAKVTLPPKIPWELVYAIMRQESEFRPWVTSRVGARGLMQVIPETANEVCANRKLPPPVLKTLYRPETSVQYGVWHLEDLMKRLNGRLPLVIAGYNAGPEAVERWIKERPIDPIDVFIEEISYSETRRYVKKVLTNLWIYRRLHADGKTALQLEPGLDRPIAAAKQPPRGVATATGEQAATDDAAQTSP